MYPQRKDFTLADAFNIQSEQLAEWETKLNFSCYVALLDKAEEANKNVTDPYHVFRGTDMSNFIANWKPSK